MESEKEKYERWLAGKEAAKKMWHRKYCEMRAQRDAALSLLRANTACSGLATTWAVIAVAVGFVSGAVTMYLIIASR